MDSREHELKESLFENFDQYQGPALYAWNNGVFKRDDWISLCKINKSSKGKDVLKVGRFGLGFLSVFHLTGILHSQSYYTHNPTLTIIYMVLVSNIKLGLNVGLGPLVQRLTKT